MQFLIFLLIAPLACTDRIVVTNNGPIKGTTLTDKKVEAFLGIPYAEPPVGSLRFSRPVPKSSWDEIYNADELPVSCIQTPIFLELDNIHARGLEMSEDCLYLNVWVPECGKDLKPIMLFIYGGAFMFGSSNMKLYDGAALSERGDVIVATINYRVGTLGFFSGFIEEANGSMGMYDQLMAIQWIKDNAAHFGGDPDNIVLFGESSGANSIGLHMISPLSKNLFKRAILQSGSAFQAMYSTDNKYISMSSQIVANMLGCADNANALKENPKDVVDCLKRLPAEKFSENDRILFDEYGLLIPRIGDEFLPVNPIDSFRKGDIKKAELLAGITRDEGSFILSMLKPQIFGLFGEKTDVNAFNETSAREILQSIMKVQDDNEVIEHYLGRVKDESRYTYLDAMSEVVGDFFITCGTIAQADHESLNGNPVFFYMLDYRPPTSPFPQWMGVAHFTELPYVFGNPFTADLTKYEKELSNDMMDMWTAFAKTGNPNIPGAPKWPRYTYQDPKYLVIGNRDRVEVRPDNHRCKVMRKYLRLGVDGE